jgi:hypothetical protein
MEIIVKESENYLFINLVDEDGELVMETPVFTQEDVKKVLKSYSLFVHSIVLLENISTDESQKESNEILKAALETYSNIDEKTQ